MPTSRSLRRARNQQERDEAQSQPLTPAATSSTPATSPTIVHTPDSAARRQAVKRPTRAMRGNGLEPLSLHPRSSAPPPNRASLRSFRYIALQDQTVVTSEGQDTENPDWTVSLYFDPKNVKNMVVEAESGVGRVVARAIFPHARYKVEVRLLEPTYTISVEHYDEQKMVASYAFELDHKDGTNRARNMWNRITGVLKNMPHDVLRYTNVPRPLATIESGAIGQYNLRNRRVRSEVTVGSSVVLTLPNTTFRMEWTGAIASPKFQALVRELRSGRPKYSGEIEYEVVAAPAAEPGPSSATSTTTTATQNVAENETVGARVMLQSCAVCNDGEIPLGRSNIARRRYRHTWIGCQKVLECKSAGMWFHIDKPDTIPADQCSGVTRHDLRKYGKWWCPLCRIGIQGLNELGIIHE